MEKTGLIPGIFRFVEKDLWEARLKDLPRTKALLIRCLRVVFLAVRGFLSDRCQKTASTLTYYSMLNAVPVVAVAFAIAKGFGLEKMVRSRITDMAEKAQWQSEITDQILGFSSALLEQARGGLIAGLGIILLFYTVVSILGKIEDSFNEVWGVKKARTMARKFSDYITMMAFAPILIVFSGSVTVMAASKLKVIVHSYPALEQVSFLIYFLAGFLPYISIWALLTVVYLIMPNTRVPVRSCAVGGIAAGTLYQIIQWVYIKFQIGVASYGAIYGSFAALPLFLVWLQMSWMIVLFGAELAHGDRHYETFGFHPDYDRISHGTKRLLALRIYHLLVQRFSKGETPMNVEEIAYTLEIPFRLTQDILSDLISTGLAVEVVRGKRGDSAFQPGRSIEDITIKNVLDAYDGIGNPIALPERYEEESAISLRLKDMAESIERSPANVRVKDIAARPASGT